MIPTLTWQQTAPQAAFHLSRAWKTATNPTPLHTHDFAELFWIDAGQGWHRGPFGTQPLPTGALVFLQPSDTHAIETSSLLQLTNVAFPRDTYDWLCQRHPTPWTGQPTPALQQLDPAQLQRLGRAAEELFGAPRTRLSIERFLLNLLYMLSQATRPGLPAHAPAWLRHACTELAKPVHFRQGGPALARLAGRSPEHVARISRRLLGQTPSDYANRLRLQYAARQLALTDAKIMQIALDCGLSNLSHFYRLFRRQFGMTPQAYRAQQRELA